jgi:hypothetical protein
MDLRLTINADFEKASKAFNDLANSSETTRQKIEKFSSSFQDKTIDSFISKQKLLEASLTGTRGEISAMTTAQNNYSKEIERLIKSGLDPESDAIKKLRDEQDNLTKKIKDATEAQEAQEKIIKSVEKAALGALGAIAGMVTAYAAIIQNTAKAGDNFAKTARVIGITAEAFQELEYAAEMSGVTNLKGSLEKLNKSISDLKGGTGSLTTYLKENNTQLLYQLENVKSNEEAFNLLMDAIGKAPDEFTRAELAQSAFGKSGQELILLANEGAEGISNLREEARKYGIISEEATRNSEAFLDAQSRLKSAVQGVGIELTEKMIPGITNTINEIADFIANIDDWEEKLNFIKIALASTTAGLVTFLSVSKGAKVIHDMAIAIKALQVAITGPAGIAALAISGLVAALGSLFTYEEKQKNQGKEIAQRLTEQKNKADELVTSYEKLNPQKAIDKKTTEELIRLYPDLAGKIAANVTSVNDLRSALKELDEEEPKREAAPFIDELKQRYDNYLNAVKSVEAVENSSRANDVMLQRTLIGKRVLIREFEEIRNKVNDILSTIGKEIDVENNFEIIDDLRTRLKTAEQESIEAAARIAAEAERQLRAISQRLSDIPLTPEQQLNDSINQIKSYLNQRADLEKTEGEARIKSYQDELLRIKNSESITAEERIFAERAVTEAIAEVRAQMAEKKEADEKKRLEEELNNFKKFLHERVEALVEAGKTEAEIREEILTVSAENIIAAETALNDELKNFQKEQVDYITDTLKNIGETEAQALLDRSNTFNSFLSERLNAQILANEEEKLTDEERFNYLVEQRDLLLENFKENKEAQLAIQKAYDDMIIAEEERITKSQRELLEERLGAFTTFFNGLSSLLEVAGKHNRGAAIAAKATASAEAAINSYLAFTKALSSSAPPFNYIMAAGVLASGIAQQAKIMSTTIPSAETGGRFIVPNSTGSDNSYMRVNSGEEVEVTPRGMTGFNATQNITVQLDKQVIFDVINNGIRSGDVLIAAVNY